MAKYKDLFMSYMDAHGVKYTNVDANAVKVVFSGDNMKTITVFVIFDEDGKNMVALRSWDIAAFKDDKWTTGLTVCNALNRQYRWVKFCISDEGGVSAADDAVVDESSVGAECVQLVRRMVGIVDECYPALMKALWT